MTTAAELIARLGLAAHPEGGWYRETWRADASHGERAASTAILFLLEAGHSSHWHRVDADEIWVWQGGDPLVIGQAASDDGPINRVLLGPATQADTVLHHVIPAHQWQAASPDAGEEGYSLVSCIVAPGFDFAGFELAPPDWQPGRKGNER